MTDGLNRHVFDGKIKAKNRKYKNNAHDIDG